MRQKVFSYKDLNKLIRLIKDKKIVLVGGCFDILHFGHLTFLQQAKKLGNCLIIALESDQFIKIKKQRQPIHTQQQRGEMLALLNIIDYILFLPYFRSDDEYFTLVRKIKPSIIAVTKNDSQLANKKKQAKEIKAKVVEVCPMIKGYSSSKIIKNFN